MKTIKLKFSTLLSLFLVLSFSGLYSQTAINAIFTVSNSLASGESYNASGASNSPLSANNYSYSYGSSSGFTDNQLSLLSIQAGAYSYSYEGIPNEIVFRRVDNASVSGTRDLMFYFGTLSGSDINLKAPYEPQMITAFQNNTNLLRGSDNLFSNAGDGNGNNNNIERLDVLLPGGITLSSADGQGFAVMERGVINQHDSFVIGVITEIDGSGTPLAYTNLIRANASHYGSANVIPNQSSVVVRRDNNSGELKASTSISGQGIGGIFFKFSDFGLNDGQTIYGYSIAAADFPLGGTSADFADYTNSDFFPLNTNGSGPGGIDMIALTGIVKIIDISGNVYNDINGLSDNLVNGGPLSQPSGTQLYVNLVNDANIVIQSVAVNPDGTYNFTGVPLGQVKLELSTTEGIAGDAAPARDLPNNWTHVGILPGDGGTVANTFGQATITITNENLGNINFGIQQLPLAGEFTLTAQSNPGGNNFVEVPANAFSGSDFDGGEVNGIRISSFPSGANTLEVNDVIYNSGNFPVDGIIIPTNTSGEPQQTIKVDPVDGEVDVVISYFTIDNAGFESALNGTVTIPFTQAVVIINNLFPALGFGTLAYEDLWPGKGDYDFNDIVIDYQFEIISNTSNYVEQLTATFVLKAFGASFENGFGFQLSENIDPSDLTVTGHALTDNIITNESNGTEAGQSKPTIIVFDNAFTHMPHPGIGIGVNTTPGAPYVQPVTFTINIQFKADTYSYNDLDISNFNPFIIVNKNRSHEVHLPNYPPTDLADASLFGQWEDASDPGNGKYYVTVENLPWAINIYESFDYPIEKQDILAVHLKFAEWAMSGGVQFPDWYKNLQGYRNSSLIYQIPAK
jgi:LruC domain-containing protein